MSQPIPHSWPKTMAAVCAVAAIAYGTFNELPITFGYDPHEQNCLPDVHLVTMARYRPSLIKEGELVFWKPSGALAYVNLPYALKRVGGIAGDHLVINASGIAINGQLIATGLPLAKGLKQAPEHYYRDEVIPQGKLFMFGTHPESNDSRYWGYLSTSEVKGKAYKIY